MDIVAIKYANTESGVYSDVAFIQCKSFETKFNEKKVKEELRALIDFAKLCGAFPVWAHKHKHNTILVNLLINEPFNLY